MFRIACFQFGYPMFAAPISGGPQWSDRQDEAHLYDQRDSRERKLWYWRGEAESCGLDPDTVLIVEAV